MGEGGNGRVVVAYLHEPDVGANFHLSLFGLFMWDLTHEARILGGGGHIAKGSTPIGIPFARTAVVEQFLSRPDEPEWLLWVDSDMGFAPDSLERLIAVADPVERPVVGALCFAQTSEGIDECGSPTMSTYPTLYKFDNISKLFGRLADYPRDELLRVDGTGAAFLLIHRSVFAKIAALEGVFGGPKWFHQIARPFGEGDFYGEDLSFCLRAHMAGVPVHVHTGVRTAHQKTRYLTERLFDAELRQVANFVVIPARDQLAMTRDLVLELERQGEVDKIFVMDHGSGAEFRNWFDTHGGVVQRVDCSDCDGISQMWNRGLDLCVQEHTRHNVALLNNDITVGPGFVGKLARTLRSEAVHAVVGPVGPEYDGDRAPGTFHYVEGIAAGRQDGSGLPGWAFMLKGESMYRFPEECKWWYGDNDLVAFVLKEHLRVVVAHDAECEHIDGGSQTGDWEDPAVAEQLEADRRAFEERWSKLRALN